MKTNRSSVQRTNPDRVLRIESLESRRLLAGAQPIAAAEPSSTVHFRFDYSNDTGFFRDHPERRALLEQAGRMITDRLSDTLDAIPASSSAIPWQAHYTNPATGANTKLPSGFRVGANEIVVYAGGRSLQSLDFPGGGRVRALADGVKTPFSYSCPATTQVACTAFGNALTTRGEGVTQGSGAVDFAPFVASLSFDTRSDTVKDWNFEDGPLLSSQYRFLTFAQHELAHVLGFGISNSFTARASGGKFVGPKTDAAYVGAGHLPLNGGHVGQSVAGEQPTIMTSNIQNNGLLTAVDFAILDDIGWQVVGDPRPSVTITTSANALPENGGAFEITATLSSASTVPITLPFSIRGTGKVQTDFTLSKNQFVFAANQKTATVLVNVINDNVYEAAESMTFAVLDSAGAKPGSKAAVSLTIFDDDGFDLATVRRDAPALVAGTLTIPGDSQPHAVVFTAAKSQTLSVVAAGIDHIDAGVLLFGQGKTIVGTYEATGLTSAALQQGASYALVFYPRTVTQKFSVSLAGGFNATPARHNVLFPEDVNGSYGVTEVDALQIINQLNQATSDAPIDASKVSGDGFYDVNGSGLITALDALLVINYLNRPVAGGEPLSNSELVSVAPITSSSAMSEHHHESHVVDTPAQVLAPVAKLSDATPTDAEGHAAVPRIAAIDRVFATDADFSLQALSESIVGLLVRSERHF